VNTKISPARHGVYQVLTDVFIKGAFSNVALQTQLLSLKKQEDRALLSAVTFGTIKKRNRLDKVITDLSSRRLADIDERLRVILEMSLFQMLYLDRIPSYALVNDAVNLAKRYGTQSGASFVNGVLRAADRDKQNLLTHSDSLTKELYFEYGIGEVVLKILRDSGYDKNALLSYAEATSQAPTTFIVVNTLKTNGQDLMAALIEEGSEVSESYLPGVLEVTSANNLFLTQSFKDGHFFVQDLSGTISGHVLAPKKGDRILDLCSAPGGKSFNAAVLAGGDVHITCCDVVTNKLEVVKRTAAQLAIPFLRVLKRDGTKPAEQDKDHYDAVICDVPCSGLGVVQRKPEILSSLTEAHVASLPALQKSLLNSAFFYLKPGGSLVYSTCTVNTAENEDVVRAFLEAHPDASLTPIKLDFPLIKHHPELDEGFLKLVNYQDKCDSFFMAKLTKLHR
jgi:16S rRNA (cytosine967-C5)-methyltransferase